ncbi:MAG: hypothetical protein IJ764_01795 [Bacteroidales bacterium]|nr:hypothetical protein [Bacteroidales bacterium]
MKKNKVSQSPSFWQFLLQKEQIIDLSILSAVFLVIGILMRVFYPFPFFFPDSYTYVHSAATNAYDIYRPMGYSDFLRLLHGFSESIGFVFCATYTFYVIASLLLLFSAKYILQIRRHWLFLLMSLCAILSPRLIFSCNYIMSDAIFFILCAVYVTSMLWMLHGRSWIWTIVSVIVLWWMCRLRYSGLFFIPVSIVVMLVSFGGYRRPLAYVMACVPLLFAVIFYNTVKHEYKEATGVGIFSGFGGWQNMNNALVLFPEAKELPAKGFKGNDVRRLHTFMQQCADSLFNASYSLSTGYMWNNSLPPKLYTYYLCETEGTRYGPQWVRNGELYGRYASQLIAKRPVSYLCRFFLPSLWSNTEFYPFLEENIVFVNEKMFRDYYHVEEDSHTQQCHFFTRIADPIRRVTQPLHLMLVFLAAVYFCITIRRENFSDKRFLCQLCLLLSFVIILGGQAVSSPNTTWRYTMPFYQSSIIFIFACLNHLCERLRP